MSTVERRLVIIGSVLLTLIAGAWVVGKLVNGVATDGGTATVPTADAPAADATATPAGGTVASVTVDENGELKVAGSLADADKQAQSLPSATATAERARRPVARRPAIVQRPIPFDDARKADMAAYSQRHYGDASYRLTDPKVIVEHFTVTSSFEAAYNTFARNRADAELGEKPGTCAHFVVDRDGTIYQLVALSIRCRHTVGLNDTAIGIEHVGMNAREILSRPRQLAAIVALSAWLRCRDGIRMSNIIGHAESLTSPYHHENVPRLARQTHADWSSPEARRLRRRIARVRCG